MALTLTVTLILYSVISSVYQTYSSKFLEVYAQFGRVRARDRLGLGLGTRLGLGLELGLGCHMDSSKFLNAYDYFTKLSLHQPFVSKLTNRGTRFINHAIDKSCAANISTHFKVLVNVHVTSGRRPT